jgi:hypothetical protein
MKEIILLTPEEMATKYLEQKARMKETNRLWRLKHKTEIITKVKSYYQLNKERLNKRSMELVKEKRDAKREIKMDISTD